FRSRRHVPALRAHKRSRRSFPSCTTLASASRFPRNFADSAAQRGNLVPKLFPRFHARSSNPRSLPTHEQSQPPARPAADHPANGTERVAASTDRCESDAAPLQASEISAARTQIRSSYCAHSSATDAAQTPEPLLPCTKLYFTSAASTTDPTKIFGSPS